MYARDRGPLMATAAAATPEEMAAHLDDAITALPPDRAGDGMPAPRTITNGGATTGAAEAT